MRYIIFIIFLLLPFITLAATSTNYQLTQEALGFTEFNASSANFKLDATIGDVVISKTTSANYTLNQGKIWAFTEPETEPEVEVPDSVPQIISRITPSVTGVTFVGRAYPLSRVELLKDGQIVASILAGPDARFSITVSGVNAGSHNFSIVAIDDNGRRSRALVFPITLASGVTIDVGGLYLAPTLAVDKDEVKQGDNIAIFGQTTPDSEVTIGIASENETFYITSSDDDGVFLYNHDTTFLEKGDHEARAKSTIDGEISDFGYSVAFIVGDETIRRDEGICPLKGDLNGDCRVNLFDFSIAAYWYKLTLSEQFSVIETERLNNDGVIDIFDFSIMAYYWTG